MYYFADVESSLRLFGQLVQLDPYRLDDWDVYSHLLYLKERRMELAHLAQRAVAIDKYRVETCCVIGKCFFSFVLPHRFRYPAGTATTGIPYVPNRQAAKQRGS